MKSVKQSQKDRNNSNFEEFAEKPLRKKRKVKFKSKIKREKNMDWQALLMEEGDSNSEDS
jgi:hypothetical protein